MFGDKLTVAQTAFVTVFSMGIVFFSLILISFMIDGLNVLLNKKKKDEANQQLEIVESNEVEEYEDEDNDEEIAAVIAAALAATLSTSVDNITIKNIRRVPQNTAVWGRMGRQEQIYN